MALTSEQKLFRRIVAQTLVSGKVQQTPDRVLNVPEPLRGRKGFTILGVVAQTYMWYADNELGYIWKVQNPVTAPYNEQTLALISTDDRSGMIYTLPSTIGQYFCGGDDGLLPFHLERWQQDGVDFAEASRRLYASVDDPHGLCTNCWNLGLLDMGGPNPGCDEFDSEEVTCLRCIYGALVREKAAHPGDFESDDDDYEWLYARRQEHEAIESMVDPLETLANLTAVMEQEASETVDMIFGEGDVLTVRRDQVITGDEEGN